MALVVTVKVNFDELYVMSMQNIGRDKKVNCVYKVNVWVGGKEGKPFMVNHTRSEGAEVLIAKSMLAYRARADQRKKG